jgi:hypothetical protein
MIRRTIGYDGSGPALLRGDREQPRGTPRLTGAVASEAPSPRSRPASPLVSDAGRDLHVRSGGLDRGLMTMAHHGPEAYRNDFELVLRRESAHPNDLWQADHTELDVMVFDETGKPALPRLR